MKSIDIFGNVSTEEQGGVTQKWDIAMAAERKEREKQEQLGYAISEAEKNGKETFDYAVFAESYWRKNAFTEPLSGDEPEKMQESYREEYYLDFPEVMSIKEFAGKLEERDAKLRE